MIIENEGLKIHITDNLIEKIKTMGDNIIFDILDGEVVIKNNDLTPEQWIEKIKNTKLTKENPFKDFYKKVKPVMDQETWESLVNEDE